jgi:penicillin-binding protein-related factor A (putative recombinase)
MSSKPETQLVKDIRDYLHYRGAVTTRVNSGLTVLGSEKENNKRVIRNAEAGTADIIGCYQGRYFAIEAKIKPNKPTPDQERFLESVREAGGLALVAYGLDDIDRAFDWEPYYV